jgi:hypothetical protein
LALGLRQEIVAKINLPEQEEEQLKESIEKEASKINEFKN